MKQLTFSESQWALLRRILIDAQVHEWNEWNAWKESESGILLAGMDAEQYRRALAERWVRYSRVSQLYRFFENNSREIEEDKA